MSFCCFCVQRYEIKLKVESPKLKVFPFRCFFSPFSLLPHEKNISLWGKRYMQPLPTPQKGRIK